MGRTLEEILEAWPSERRKAIEARFEEMALEVESLGELRRLAGKAQSDVASALGVKQPSVSKIEKQADMYLSTLRSYVEAIGGQLDVIARLPSRPPVRIERFSDVVRLGAKVSTPRRRRAPAPKPAQR